MKTLLAMIFSFAVSGCTNVKSADLVGTWVLSNPSRSLMKLEPGTDASLVLDKEGTFVAANLPRFLHSGGSSGETSSGNGRWRMIARDGKQQVQLDFHKIVGWNGPLPYGAQLEVSGKSLYYFVDDPDEAKRVSLQRQ